VLDGDLGGKRCVADGDWCGELCGWGGGLPLPSPGMRASLGDAGSILSRSSFCRRKYFCRKTGLVSRGDFGDCGLYCA
jgi:hypothetical protein